jgi:hypothetical protein
VKVIRNRPRSVDIDEFLSRPLFAHLATASEDGPRESPEPRCAIGIVDFNRSEGRVHHAGLRGRATIERFGRGRARRLLRRYLGEDESQWDAARFPEPLDYPDNVRVRFAPETAVARDRSYRPAKDLTRQQEQPQTS